MNKKTGSLLIICEIFSRSVASNDHLRKVNHSGKAAMGFGSPNISRNRESVHTGSWVALAEALYEVCLLSR